MPRPPIWTIEARCKDGDQPPLIVEIAAHSALEALTSAAAELTAAGPAPRQLEATWPDYVTVMAHPSTTHGHRFSIRCLCGADWGIQDRGRALYVLRETIPNHHGPGRCEGLWPENRSPAQPGPLNQAGAEIKRRREAAKMSQARLAEAAGVSPATISTAERVLGGVSPLTMRRIHAALDEANA